MNQGVCFLCMFGKLHVLFVYYQRACLCVLDANITHPVYFGSRSS